MTEVITLTPQMGAVLGLLGLTVVLFVTEVVAIDVAAVLVLVLIGLSGLVPGLDPLVPADQLFDGFASNAVISIIAVMILGAGLDRTGVMGRVAQGILRIAGSTERRVMTSLSLPVGIMSGFVQNIGAAALFLPVASRISARTGISISRLLMPMGAAAILGGTVTMVGSSPLILVNDLIANSNAALPPGVDPVETFGLFDVTPIGLSLLVAGIAWFVLLGPWILPAGGGEDASQGGATLAFLHRSYDMEGEVFEVRIPAGSPLDGSTVEAWDRANHGMPVVARIRLGELVLSPTRASTLAAGDRLALMGSEEEVEALAARLGLERMETSPELADALSPDSAGVSEVVVPPRSPLVGKAIHEVQLRKHYGMNLLAVRRGATRIQEDLLDHVLQVGDTLACHSRWEALARLERQGDFVVVTTDYPHEELRPHKVPHAVFFFAVAMGLVLLSPLKLSVSLLVGAVGMVITGVLSMSEAYRAVSWKTVFLLASLIPLGVAVESSGTAAWIAQQALSVAGGLPDWGVQAIVGLLATVFSLVMSNVGATVLLVPLAINIALASGGDPATYALIVAVATSNAFLLPTHQVNALLMGPGGYRVKDFVKAGSGLSLLFLVVLIVVINLIR